MILTTYEFIKRPELLTKLESRGINKFIAYELPIDLVKARYGTHYDIVQKDVHESDDMRVLEHSGERAFKNFSFSELGPEIIYYESEEFT